jgi:hypothetical protein
MFFMTSYGQNTQGTAEEPAPPPDPNEIKLASGLVLSFINHLMKDSNIDEAMNMVSLPMILDSESITQTSVLKQRLGVLYYDLHKPAPYQRKIDSVYFVAYHRSKMYDAVPTLYFINLTMGFYKDDQHGTKQALVIVQIGDKPRIVGMKTE